MKAIKSFFKKVWDSIRSNAWIQPILFVVAIFLVILAVQGIGKASQNWSCSKKDEKYVKEILFEKVEEKIEEDDSFILYIGYESCSGCQAFQPVLKKFHEKNKNVTVYHLNVNVVDGVYDDATLTSEGMADLWELIIPVVVEQDGQDAGQYTPTVVAINQGEFVKAYQGGGRSGVTYSDMMELVDAMKAE